jgi:amino acid transporter
MSVTPMKHWSAILPLAMSIAAVVLVLGHVAISGGVHETDEGTAAHVWQLLMAAQVPLVAFFAITWLPRAPRVAPLVLALQAAAVLANLAAVRFFNL